MNSRILLIDDDHGPMDYFVEALRHRGCTVEHIDTVDGFFERLDHASEPPDFDIAIIDMMLPHGERLSREMTNGGLKSGIAIVQAIKRKFPHLPIVAFSNYDVPEVRASLPADVKFITKFEVSPFDFADFIKTITPAHL